MEALQESFTSVQKVTVKDHADGLAALESGAADSYASDRTILVGLAVTSKDPSKLALSDQGFLLRALRPGDAAQRLRLPARR